MAPAPSAAVSPSASIVRHGRDIDAARVARWLLASPAQQVGTAYAGAVAGWIGADGQTDYVYPEITGYYLQWLAWMTQTHGRQPAYVARAEAALQWLTRWLTADQIPATRIYVDGPRQDWRNDALFAFDVAMVLRGVGAAVSARLLVAPAFVIEWTCSWLSKLIGVDGQLEACLKHRNERSFPDRWSTRRGPFLAKAAAGIIDAALALPEVPTRLRIAAQRTFDVSIDALLHTSHAETHPFLYAVEGFLALPEDAAFGERLPKVAARFDALLHQARQIGCVPETLNRAGTLRLDIVAQTVRAGLLLNALQEPRTSSRRELDNLAYTLAQNVCADGAVPFTPDAHAAQFTVWTAMFAEQALALAYREPREIATIACAPLIV
jgi:hypothetical protein